MNTDVLVIGGGPAGLAAAAELARRGVGRVVLVEREGELGGTPRHCAHSPFGMREFGRVLSGHRYAEALAARARSAGAELFTRHSVAALRAGPSVGADLATPDGLVTVTARAIVLATGIRETSRAARLLPGTRPLGILTTGALQDYVHLRGLAPFRRPVILGSELVTLSVLLTCASGGISPAALIEEEAAPRVGYPLALYPLLRGIPVHYGATILDIVGNPRVETVRIRRRDGSIVDIDCDGVLLTGRFTPEASLGRLAGLDIDRQTAGPVVGAAFETSARGVFAAGNVLRAVRTAGQCWAEGRRVAAHVAQWLATGTVV